MFLAAKDSPAGSRITGFILAFSIVAVVAMCLCNLGTASAAEVDAAEIPKRQFPLAQVFTFLFLMLGPFKIIGPFSRITEGMDARSIRRIAILSILFSIIALLLAGLLGERILENYGIPLPILALSTGIILFLVALLGIIQQFSPHTSHADEPADEVRGIRGALVPLAFPTIVTPYGIATVVVFLALSPDLEGRLTVGVVVASIMAVNLIVMIVLRHIMPVLAIALPILGAVLGIIQVALGLQIINNSLTSMGYL